HRHLQDLVALLLAAGEAGVDGAAEEGLVHLQLGHVLLDELQEVDRPELVEAARGAHGVDRRAQEVHVADAGDLDGMLEGEEETAGGALFRCEREQVGAVELDGAGDVVAVATGENVGERRLAGAVGAHHGVHLAGGDVEVEAVEDDRASGGRVEVGDVEHHPTAPSSVTRISAWASMAYSIGSSSNTSRQKPLTIMDVASSSVRPRWRQ